MDPMLQSGSSSIFIPRCSQESLYYSYPAAMSRLTVLCALLCYLYSSTMVRIFLCTSFTTMLLVLRDNGADLPVLQAHLLLYFVHNKNRFWYCSGPLVFNPLLYIGTTSSWLLNLLSRILLQFGVTSIVPCISVWLYVTSSHLYGYALASLRSSHSWYFMFPCVSWTLMEVSVTSLSCACLFMSISNLFQNFRLRVSPYFKILESVCLPIFDWVQPKTSPFSTRALIWVN